MNPIINDIVWENNSRVKSSSLINPSKIISKSSTADFPAGKVTIRLHNTSKKNVCGTAYFYGKLKTYNAGSSSFSGNNYTYDSADCKLIVTFSKDKDEFVFNGGLSKSYSLQDVTDVISYCKELLNKL